MFGTAPYGGGSELCLVSCVFVLLLLLLPEMATRYVLEGEDQSNVGWHFVPEVLCQVCYSFESSTFEVLVVK